MRVATFILAIACAYVTCAQDAYRYLSKVTSELRKVEALRAEYTDAAARVASPMSTEKKRRALLRGVSRSVIRVAALRPFGTDSALRDSMVRYLSLSFACVNEEFVTVADMETISELSFDAMESYLMARESAFRTVHSAAASLNSCIGRFARRHGIEMVQDTPRPGKFDAFMYYNFVYAAFFDCYKQEAYLLESIEREDLAAVEQNRKALLKVANDAMRRLDERHAQNGDSLAAACRGLLTFYAKESELLAGAAPFLAEADNFSRLKEVFQFIEPDKKSVELFFSTLLELGRKEQALRVSLGTLSVKRNELMQDWNSACASYLTLAAE
jgi:hypothetical protein